MGAVYESARDYAATVAELHRAGHGLAEDTVRGVLTAAMGSLMRDEPLSVAELGDLLGASPDTARALMTVEAPHGQV
jgi:hypothetical protein